MTYKDMLKLWATIKALSETKAKLALFGLVIQKLGQEGENISDFDAVLKELRGDDA